MPHCRWARADGAAWRRPAAFPFMEVDVTPNPLLSVLGEIKPNADGTLSVPSARGWGSS